MKNFIYLGIVLLIALAYFGINSNEPDIIWDKFVDTRLYEPTDIIQSDDGNYLIIGESSSLMPLVIKVENNGDVIWSKSYGTGIFNKIQKTTDGGYIVVGRSSYGNESDFLIIRLKSDGNIVWTKTYGGPNSEEAISVEQTTDGSFIVAGNKDISPFEMSGTNENYNKDYWVIKLDDEGNQIWSKTYGGSKIETLIDLVTNNKGNYVLKGTSTSKDGDLAESRLHKIKLSEVDSIRIARNLMPPNTWDVEIDISGKIINSKNRRGSFNDTKDYYLPNSKNNDRIIINSKWIGSAKEGSVEVIIEKLGSPSWEKTIGNPGRKDIGVAIKQTNDGGYIFVATSQNTNGYSQLWLVKLDADK